MFVNLEEIKKLEKFTESYNIGIFSSFSVHT